MAAVSSPHVAFNWIFLIYLFYRQREIDLDVNMGTDMETNMGKDMDTEIEMDSITEMGMSTNHGYCLISSSFRAACQLLNLNFCWLLARCLKFFEEAD